MASLRTAHPRLRNYFKENYIPQVCEALLCGILVTCPEDPLRYLEKMLILIIENGLESLLWDMCIDPSMKPKIRRLSETYLEQLFGLDDQLVTPELMIKACSFYTGHLLKTHFCTWKDIAIPPVREDDILAEKMERAIRYYNSILQKSVFRHWHSYVESHKEKLKATMERLQQMFYCQRLTIILMNWQNKAREKSKRREDELDESMRHISEGCPGVLYLNLSNTTITNRTMRLLPRYFQNLQNLSLAYCRKFTDKGLQYLNLGNGCHKLIYLDLSGCTQISVQGFRNIASSCSGIMHLTINDMPTLTDNCVKALVEKCSRITSVVLTGAPHISDHTFKALSTCNLRKIRFEGNKRISDACFKFIDKNYPNINHIYMADCKEITDSSLKSLSLLRQLTVLNLANCVREAAHKMSSVVQQQEYSSNDPPPWFGYDSEGKPLSEDLNTTVKANLLFSAMKESAYKIEEEI
ncbi:F-box/LRR-repeat protein 13 [Tupaia chinensis]|uniref:F-box/LRR-repeat protein 13 n=1 Tax=Tupaia chinensis TaxID=246437 RepID=L9LBN7_TUPCH|nr:F-box/LRR-repeat protein 13 [Tupaia chinensis]